MGSAIIESIDHENEKYRRFLKHITVDSSGCWVFGRYSKDGYGRFKPWRHMTLAAHRYSYEIHKGSIPSGMVIDHLCRRKQCCNPEHLEPVTPKENVRRGVLREVVISRDPAISARFRAAGRSVRAKNARSQTHCKRGHEYTEANTRFFRGIRHCRACAVVRREARRQSAQ